MVVCNLSIPVALAIRYRKSAFHCPQARSHLGSGLQLLFLHPSRSHKTSRQHPAIASMPHASNVILPSGPKSWL